MTMTHDLLAVAAAEVSRQKRQLEAQVESLMANFTYEQDGCNPMVAIPLADMEAHIAALGNVQSMLAHAVEGARP